MDQPPPKPSFFRDAYLLGVVSACYDAATRVGSALLLQTVSAGHRARLARSDSSGRMSEEGGALCVDFHRLCRFGDNSCCRAVRVSFFVLAWMLTFSV